MNRNIDFIENPEKIKLSLDESRSKILSLLNINEMTIPDLADALGLNQSTVYVHLDKLKEEDLVEVVKEKKEHHIPQKVFGRKEHAYLLVPNEQIGKNMVKVIFSQIDHVTLHQLEELGYYNDGYEYLIDEIRDFLFKTNKYIEEKIGKETKEELREELECTKMMRAKLLFFLLEITSNEHIEAKLNDICSHFKEAGKKHYPGANELREELITRDDIETVDDPERLEVMMSPSKQEILNLLDVEDMTISQMSKSLDKHRSTVYRHVRKLQRNGFVEMKSEKVINNTPVQVYGKIADLYVPIQRSLNPDDIEGARLKWEKEKVEKVLNCLDKRSCEVEEINECAQRLREFFKEMNDRSSKLMEEQEIEFDSLIKLLSLKVLVLLLEIKRDQELMERLEDILSNIEYSR